MRRAANYVLQFVNAWTDNLDFFEIGALDDARWKITNPTAR